MMYVKLSFIFYGIIGLASLLSACAPQEMDAISSIAKKQALTGMRGELKRIDHNGEVELYIVSTIAGARHAVRLTIDTEDSFIDKLNLLGFQVTSDFEFDVFDWYWDEAVDTYNVQIHNPELTFSTSAPDSKDVSAYKVLSANGDLDYFLYFYNREPEKLFRPGCRQLVELLGIQEEQIHESDPRELLSFYYGHEIEIVDILCGDGQQINASFSDWCNATGLDPSVSRTRDVMIELANQTSCEKAQVALEQMTTLDLRGRNLKDLRPLASIITENIRRIDLSDNENLTHLEALQKYENLEELKLNNNQLDNSQVESALLEDQMPTMFFLGKLELRNNSLTNLDFLKYYMTLLELDVSHNNLKEVVENCADGGPYALEPLIGLSAMTDLDFSYNEIACLEPLDSVLDLRILKARENSIVSVEPLRDLSSLRYIDLANDTWQGEEREQGNIIEDLRPIPATVETLDADHVPMRYMRNFEDWCYHKDSFSDDGSDGRRKTIVAIEAVAGVSPSVDNYCERVDAALSTMTRFSLYNKKISNIAPLSALTKLKKLQLGGNQIVEVKALDALSKLEWLDISQNVLANHR